MIMCIISIMYVGQRTTHRLDAETVIVCQADRLVTLHQVISCPHHKRFLITTTRMRVTMTAPPLLCPRNHTDCEWRFHRSYDENPHRRQSAQSDRFFFQWSRRVTQRSHTVDRHDILHTVMNHRLKSFVVVVLYSQLFCIHSHLWDLHVDRVFLAFL
jgi:hypothetical protein